MSRYNDVIDKTKQQPPPPEDVINLSSDDEQLSSEQEQVLSATSDALQQETAEETPKDSWIIAGEIMKSFHPVPVVIWRIVRPVLGKVGEVAKVHPLTFTGVERFLYRAAREESLLFRHDVDPALQHSNSEMTRISFALDSLGNDVAAALCFIHAVCRRLNKAALEQYLRPIIDDALIRARIGYQVGAQMPNFGRGRGMLTGFSGRSGLAILIASGGKQKAQEALEGLAAGLPIRDVGLSIYACEPLQISALCLSAAGFSREAAFGTARYALPTSDRPLGKEEFLWYAAFTIIENLRMGTPNKITETFWSALNCQQNQRKALINETRSLQRRSHNLQWLFLPQAKLAEQLSPVGPAA